MIERSLKLRKDYPKKVGKDNTKKNAKIFMLGFRQFIKLISNHKTSHKNSHQSIFDPTSHHLNQLHDIRYRLHRYASSFTRYKN